MSQPKPTDAATDSQPAKDRQFSAEEIAAIGALALPIYQQLVQTELRGREQCYVAEVAFARAKSFYEVQQRLAKSGRIKGEKPKQLAAVTAPNLDSKKFKLRPQQVAMAEYIEAGEPGQEVLHKRIRELTGVN